MTLPFLKGLHQSYLNSLFYEGIVNDQFNKIHSLSRTVEPDCVVNLIEAYFGDIDVILSDLSRHEDASNFDYSKLATLAREIEEKSASIGAEHVRIACPELIQACDEKKEIKFSQALDWLKCEFAETKNKLEAYVRMEQRIIRHTNQQSQSSSDCSSEEPSSGD